VVKAKEQVAKALNQYAGLSTDQSKVFKCQGAQNDTVADCPVAGNAGKEFIVAV
jgi:hypothetical protein